MGELLQRSQLHRLVGTPLEASYLAMLADHYLRRFQQGQVPSLDTLKLLAAAFCNQGSYRALYATVCEHITAHLRLGSSQPWMPHDTSSYVLHTAAEGTH